MGELKRGVVKWFNNAKGFGFIEHDSGKDIFVHYSVIECDGFKTLKDGEEVGYEIREGDKGLNASRVVRANQKDDTPTTEVPNQEQDGKAPLSASIEVEASADTTESPITAKEETDDDIGDITRE